MTIRSKVVTFLLTFPTMHRRGRALRYTFAILVSIAAGLGRYWLRKTYGVTPTYITFYPAVGLAAAWAGVEAGFVATAVSAFLAEFMFPAISMYPWPTTASYIGFVIFLASCGIVLLVAKIASSNRDQYEALFGKSKIPILLVDPDSGAILEANAAACAYYGNSSERMCAQHIQDISALPPEKILANLQRALTGEQDQFLLQHRRANGEVRQVEVRSGPFPSRGRTLLYLVIQDVTDKTRAENELRRSQEQLRGAMAASRSGSFEWDIVHDKLILSPEMEALYGLETGTFGGTLRDWEVLIIPEDLPAAKASIEVGFQIGRAEAEWRFLNPKDGQIHWMLAQSRVEFDSEGRPSRMVGINFDVTSRKKAALALEESKTDFTTLANFVPQLIWMTDHSGKAMFVNRRWMEYSGMTLEQSSGYGWVACIHPDQKNAALKEWAEASRAGTPLQTEYRLLGSDGNYRSFLVRAVPMLDDAGSVLKWVGTCTDIEELRRADQKLRDSESQLQLQFNKMPIACVLMDRELRIMSWNPAAEGIFGFTAEEAVGRCVYDCIVPQEVWASLAPRTARLLEGDETAHGTNENIRKDGRRITCEWTNTPLKTPAGEVLGILAMVQRRHRTYQGRADGPRERGLAAGCRRDGAIGYLGTGSSLRRIKT